MEVGGWVQEKKIGKLSQDSPIIYTSSDILGWYTRCILYVFNNVYYYQHISNVEIAEISRWLPASS